MASVYCFGTSSVLEAQVQWSIGYYTPFGNSFQSDGYPIIVDLEWDALTHVNFVGGTPQSDGSILLTGNFANAASALIAAAHAHNVKVLYVLGHEGATPYDFTGAINNHLSTLVGNIVQTVSTYGFDGVDVDYEEGWNAASASSLFASLRTALGQKLLTSAALVSTAGDYTSLHQYLDRVNVMTYDLSGRWDSQSWFNSALYGPSPSGWQTVSVDLTVRRWISGGIPAAKLGIGIPFYGVLSTGNGVTGPRQAPGSTFIQVGYTDISRYYSVGNATFDSQARVPWLSTSGGWLNWENEQSLTDKIRYVKDSGLGGWVIWHVGWDYLPTETIRHPLLNAVKSARRPATPTGVHVLQR